MEQWFDERDCIRLTAWDCFLERTRSTNKSDTVLSCKDTTAAKEGACSSDSKQYLS